MILRSRDVASSLITALFTKSDPQTEVTEFYYTCTQDILFKAMNFSNRDFFGLFFYQIEVQQTRNKSWAFANSVVLSRDICVVALCTIWAVFFCLLCFLLDNENYFRKTAIAWIDASSRWAQRDLSIGADWAYIFGRQIGATGSHHRTFPLRTENGSVHTVLHALLGNGRF